ncbi:hypothetical protein ACFC00_31225 [Streptomyces adustus]|uniref:hypothetical protein n=1 Tax=Streptomyces adustus TaxID=1609272 RepID=UPI0035DD0BA9
MPGRLLRWELMPCWYMLLDCCWSLKAIDRDGHVPSDGGGSASRLNGVVSGADQPSAYRCSPLAGCAR